MTMAGPPLEGLINPAMLVWAREQSRLDRAAAAKRVGQSPERLAEWESGACTPTLNQLRQLANAYKRSVGVFFLRETPKAPRRPVDYRRLEISSREMMSPALVNGIREAEAKREAALDIFAQLDEAPPKWNLSIASDLTTEKAASFMTRRLGVTMQTRATWRSEYEALNGWRNAVESLGVIVVQLSGVPMSEMRGCSLATFPLPVILLNSADSPLGRVFTLIHELTHLARSESGLCDLADDLPYSPPIEAVEAYCNAVAGAAIVPLEALMELQPVQEANRSTQWELGELSAMRRIFWASREAILRRLLDNQKTSRAFYRAAREVFKNEYAARQQKSDKSDIRVPYYRRVLLNNGRYLTRLAVNAYGSRTITGAELSRILNAKLDHLPKIREALVGEVIA